MVSEKDYHALRDECLAYLHTQSIDPSEFVSAMMLCAACCIFCPMMALNKKAKQITSDLQAIAARHAPRWAGASMSVELVQMASPTGSAACAIDQNGLPLVATDEDYGTRPVWPPLGYNVVLRTSTRELRNRWPQPGSAMVLPPGAVANPLRAPDAALASLLAAHGMDSGEAAAACAATGAHTVRDVALVNEADVEKLTALSLVTRKKLAAAAAAARM